MKELQVITKAVIHRSKEEVSAFASDPANAPHWYKNIEEANWIGEPILKIGNQVAFKAKFLGRELSYTYEIIDWQPFELLVMQTAEGPFPMQTTYRWEAVTEDQTQMTLINKGRPYGFSALFSPFMKRAMKKANTKDLALLKSILENTHNH